MTYMKPEEAREKACPAFRFCANEEQVIRDGRSAVYYHELCRADACILWRWKATPTRRSLGYCGLGGRPE